MITKEKNEGWSPKSLLTDAVILAFSTALAYVYAYFFESSYLRAFGLNVQTARVTPEIFIGLGILILAGLLFGLLVLSFLGRLKPRGILGEAIKFWTTLALLLLPLAYLRLDFYVYSMAVFAVMAPLLMLIDQRKAKNVRPVEKLAAGSITSGHILFDKYLAYVFICFVLFSICGVAGAWSGAIALREKQQKIVDDTYVVVREYGETILAAEVDPATGKLSGSYRYYRIDNQPNLSFEIKNFPPLQAPNRSSSLIY